MTTREITPVVEEDRLRADLYDFLGAVLTRAPSSEVLEQIGALTGDDTELGGAVTDLAKAASRTTAAAAEREFNALFIGVGRGELVPYASYYMTGFLNEKPLAKLRRDMGSLGIERSPDVYEPEDNAGSLCEMMAGLILGRFGAPAGISRQRDFWNTHIGPWAPHFFADLETAKNASFYAPVGTLGRAFMAVEKDAFRLAGDTAA